MHFEMGGAYVWSALIISLLYFQRTKNESRLVEKSQLLKN